MGHIPGQAIGQVAFEVGPDELIRVELGSIAGEESRMESRVALQPALDDPSPVGPAPVPQEHEGAPEMPEQVSQEAYHLRGANVLLGMEPEVEGHPLPSGRDTEDRDRRDLGPGAGHHQMGRLTPRGPRGPNAGHQEKAALIQEHQMGPKPCGLFLYAARRDASSSGWPARCAPAPVSRAFADSSPRRASASRDWPSHSGVQSGAAGPARCASGSTGRWHSRPPGVRPITGAPAAAFADPTAPRAVPESAGAAIPPFRASGTLGATAPRNSTTREPGGRQPGSFRLPPRAEWREVFASLALLVFPGVSCPRVYRML